MENEKKDENQQPIGIKEVVIISQMLGVFQGVNFLIQEMALGEGNEVGELPEKDRKKNTRYAIRAIIVGLEGLIRHGESLGLDRKFILLRFRNALDTDEMVIMKMLGLADETTGDIIDWRPEALRNPKP